VITYQATSSYIVLYCILVFYDKRYTGMLKKENPSNSSNSAPSAYLTYLDLSAQYYNV